MQLEMMCVAAAHADFQQKLHSHSGPLGAHLGEVRRQRGCCRSWYPRNCRQKRRVTTILGIFGIRSNNAQTVTLFYAKKGQVSMRETCRAPEWPRLAERSHGLGHKKPKENIPINILYQVPFGWRESWGTNPLHQDETSPVQTLK